MNKELIERLIRVSGIEDGLVVNSSEALEKFIERYLAGRGKEAIGWACWFDEDVELSPKDAHLCNYEPKAFKNRKPVFLAPQIPEGMALVPKKFSRDIAKRYLGRELLNMDRVWFSVATRDYEQMIAAAGVAP